MRSLLPILVMGCAVSGHAQTVEWEMTRAIDVALPVALPTRAATRTLILPCKAVNKVPSLWTEEQLYARLEQNTIIFQLRDPSFSGTVTAYGDNGEIFLLNVRAARDGERLDETLLLRPLEGQSRNGERRPPPADSDGAICHMMRYMVSGAADPHYQASLITRVVDGKIVLGRPVYVDDALQLMLIKAYQGPALRGYQLLLSYSGKKTVAFNAQTLWFEGALAVHATGQVLWDPSHPGLALQPQQTVQVFYVCEP